MTKQEILSALRGGQHDLSLPADAQQKVLDNAWIKPYLDSVKEAAESFRGKPIPSIPYSCFKLFHETGDRWMFEDSEVGYFPRRGRLAAFAVLSWLYGREEDLRELEDTIWAICDEYTWSVAAHLKPDAYTTQLQDEDYMVDLFASETAQALSEISFLLGDALPPIIKKRIDHLVKRRVLDRVLTEEFNWMHAASNWAAVCAGSVGMAAIYTLRDDEERLAEVLECVWPAFDSFLSSFAEDGSCLEGIGYWNYGFSYYTSFADLMLRRTGGKIDLFTPEKVKKIALFQQKCYFAGGRTVSFSDGNSRASFAPGLSSYLSRKFDGVIIPPSSCMADFNEDHCHRWSNVLRDLLWSVDASDTQDLSGCYPLPSAQWYLCSAANGVGLAAKAGHNGEPHNHNDVGNLQIFKNGEEILCDLGSGEYTRQYFSDQRYTFITCGSQGHSVPMIDGYTQKAGREAAAADVSVSETGISMELAPVYELEALSSLRRRIEFDAETGKTTLTDRFVFDGGKHKVQERFVTYGNVQVDGALVRLLCGHETMVIHFDAKRFTPVITPMEYSAHFGVHKHFFVVDFVAEMEGDTEVSFVIE